MSESLLKWDYFPQIKVSSKLKSELFPKKELELKIADEVEKLNELKTILSAPSDSNLYIRSNHFTIPLSFACQFFSLSTILDSICILPNSSTPTVTSNIWLEFIDEGKRKNIIKLSLPVCTTDGNFMMKFPLNAELPISINLISQKIAVLLDIEPSNIFLVDSNIGIFEPSFDSFLNSLIREKLFIMVKLPPKKIGIVKERSQATSELLTSEIIYINKLNVISEYIIPFFENNDILLDQELTQLKVCISTMLLVNEPLKDSLVDNQFSFMAPVGEVFLKFLSSFSAYDIYYDVQPIITTKLAEFSKDSTNRYLVDALQSEPRLDNLSISSYIIEPVQRIPRYRMLLDRILKSTPGGHPDRIPLISAIDKLNDARKIINEKAVYDNSPKEYAREMGELKEIIPLESNQGFIKKYDVKTKQGDGKIILYTNKVKIFYLESQKIISLDYVDMRIISHSPICCTIYAADKKFDSTFREERYLKSFTESVEETSFVAQLKKAKNELGLKWEKCCECPSSLQHHSMTSLNDNLYVFGGRNDRGYLLGKLFCYNISTNTWNEIPNLDSTSSSINSSSNTSPSNIYANFPSPRQDSAMAALDGIIYLFGGYDENGSLNDFWKYKDDKWTLICRNVAVAEGGYYSMIPYKEMLLLGGGNTRFQTLLYDPNKESWTEICQNSNIPLLKYHKMVYIDIAKAVVMFGGMKSDYEPTKDLYLLNDKQNKWIPNDDNFWGMFPFPRFGHSMVYFRSHAWIIGGVGNNIPFVLTPCKQFVLIRSEGNFPQVISFFTCCAEGKSLWILGGRTEDDVSNTLYKVSILREHIIESDEIEAMYMYSIS
ncbi:hypothetical protein TRFO_04052 [Tritrichomonas foetus]|uniref:DH domain-containing protein n=1 Tax=Tritrichomonas foetus TaxID=1144522 RepID=A0A1J4KIA4_9EUKA|nr:hypothetical protein TRFO_04052 [Tritrichomonas foetus]|eukprot:OHT11103.1 hypothetical protein TRFO_04052 [Tritrichomonas foetus]